MNENRPNDSYNTLVFSPDSPPKPRPNRVAPLLRFVHYGLLAVLLLLLLLITTAHLIELAF